MHRPVPSLKEAWKPRGLYPANVVLRHNCPGERAGDQQAKQAKQATQATKPRSSAGAGDRAHSYDPALEPDHTRCAAANTGGACTALRSQLVMGSGACCSVSLGADARQDLRSVKPGCTRRQVVLLVHADNRCCSGCWRWMRRCCETSVRLGAGPLAVSLDMGVGALRVCYFWR